VDLYRKMAHVPPLNGRPVKRTLIQNSDGGSTLYIGSRQSDLFARLYDKGVEQAACVPGQWWRLELEIKHERALTVARVLQQSVAQTQQLTSMVARYFADRAGMRIPSYDGAAVCNGGPHVTSSAKQLQWLSRGVRPTVKRLLDRQEMARVVDALFPLQSDRQELYRHLTQRGDYGGSERGAGAGHIRLPAERAAS
jgi:DNA relaxase NicK